MTPDQLRALHPKGNGQSSNRGAFNLEAFLGRLGIPYDQDIHEGRERYKLEHCPFNSDQGKGETAIFRKADGMLGFKCQHDSCKGKHWQDVRELADGPRESRRAGAKPSDMGRASTGDRERTRGRRPS